MPLQTTNFSSTKVWFNVEILASWLVHKCGGKKRVFVGTKTRFFLHILVGNVYWVAAGKARDWP